MNFQFWSNLFGGEETLIKMNQYRQNIGYRGFNRGRFLPFYTPYNAVFRAPSVFVIHVLAPVQQVHTDCCSQNINNYARTYKTTNSAQKKAKRASKQLRDRLRREKFLEQKSVSVDFPFSGLTDEEMTNALSCEDMTRLSEAMKTIANLENENKMLKDSVDESRTDLINGQITQNKLKIENENLVREKQNHEMELLSAKDKFRNIQLVNKQICRKNQEMEETLRDLAAEIQYLELRSTDAGLWGHLYMTKDELLAMEKTQLAAHVIAPSLPRDIKFDVLKDENYRLKDHIKILMQKIGTLERQCRTSEEQCQTEGGENKRNP